MQDTIFTMEIQDVVHTFDYYKDEILESNGKSTRNPFIIVA
jgi:hypothetical protein